MKSFTLQCNIIQQSIILLHTQAECIAEYAWSCQSNTLRYVCGQCSIQCACAADFTLETNADKANTHHTPWQEVCIVISWEPETGQIIRSSHPGPSFHNCQAIVIVHTRAFMIQITTNVILINAY